MGGNLDGVEKNGDGGRLLPNTWALMLTRPKTGGAGEARSPERHFRDYGPAQNKLLKPGQVLAGALTVAPVFVVWSPEVPPGPPLVKVRCYTTISGFVHPSFKQVGCAGGGVV